MRSIMLGFLAFAIVAFSACEKDSNLTTDDELILAIQNATDKQVVDASTLPGTATTVLTTEYTESDTDMAQLATGLGYEVQMRRREGSRVGERTNIYFDLDGRPLRRHRHRGHRGERDRDHCDGMDLRECFDLVYPVTFIMPDGSTITGDEETLRPDIRAWYQANPDAEGRPMLQFPVEIIYEDGTPLTVNSEEELRGAYAYCREGRHDNCFELVFPITFLMPDGVTTVTGEDGQEVRMAIRAWYEANPDAEGRPELQFPVDLVFDDGTPLTVNSREELRAAHESCEE